MKSMMVALGIFAFTAHASAIELRDTAGSFELVSGDNCVLEKFDVRVVATPEGENLQIVAYWHNDYEDKTYENIAREFSGVNKGWRNWSYNWGDGTSKGIQNVVFREGELHQDIRVKAFGITIRKLSYSYIWRENSLYTISKDSKGPITECEYRRI